MTGYAEEVAGGYDGRVLVWDPAEPGAPLVELGRHENWVEAVAVLPDGRVVTGGHDGRLLLWDPAEPGTSPVELGRYESRLTGWRCCRTGGWLTGSADRRVLLWNVQSTSPGTSLACSVQALATSLSPYGTRLFIGHGTEGISRWEIRPARQNTPEPSAASG